ncbi:glycosyltransferase [Chryseobacterium camelliae]|uniref:Glycosyltransferase n=1 Tax=Chryseobacterium camelliae TaxID=1265445 RepID=A0ABY7QPD5_9FLAO|nr:glycosyltransferase [Chryseobacterium camelliae]WBV61533.1 glycosyltransferase [Chryseobacterium camelliae]
MASYNGRTFIQEQIDSILKQLQDGDELIIVDDKSNDNTIEIIKNYKSELIKLYQNDVNIGYVKTFEKALRLSKNQYICLTDQDDIWIEGRLNKLYKTIKNENVFLVASNFYVNNQSGYELNFLKLKTENSNNFFGNIMKIFLGKSAYYGCTMMINKDLLKYVLPFPKYIEAHDLWLAMSANLLKSVHHLNDDTLIYRIHQNNASLKKRSLLKKFKARYYFFNTIITLLKRINN